MERQDTQKRLVGPATVIHGASANRVLLDWRVTLFHFFSIPRSLFPQHETWVEVGSVVSRRRCGGDARFGWDVAISDTKMVVGDPSYGSGHEEPTSTL
jgi:hypothetical protein